jgi:ATP-dependent Zn proteases
VKITRARVLHAHVVRFRLDNGRHIDRDFSLVEGGVFTETWNNPKKFSKVFVVDGCPSWPGELDFCPDVILRGGPKGRVPRFAFVGRGMLISPATVATAYHESGHAVVGHQLTGDVPRKISVIPEDGSVGRTRNRPWPRSFEPLVRMTPLTRQRLEDETVTILAGFEADRRYTGRADHHGAAEDFKGAKVYARLVVGDDAEGVAAYIKWCSYLARRAVERNWDRIGRFARRLADAGELEGRELKAALTSARWAGPASSRWQA